MKNLYLLNIAMLIFCTTAFASNSTDAINIINSVVGQCKTQGMLSCEPKIKGAKLAFDYIKLFNMVSKLERDFNDFVIKKYSKNNVQNDALHASLNLNLNVGFMPEQFTSSIKNVIKVKNGFDVNMNDGSTYNLRNENGEWLMRFPPEASDKLKSLQPYITAVKIKRAILLYRMLEADITNISFDKLNNNVSQDLAPLIINMFGKEKFPELEKWSKKDINSVISFYSQFSTNKDMIQHIKMSHKL